MSIDGKTIMKHVLSGSYLCLHFTDGTHQVYGVWECAAGKGNTERVKELHDY
jgi:hypothetical protein